VCVCVCVCVVARHAVRFAKVDGVVAACDGCTVLFIVFFLFSLLPPFSLLARVPFCLSPLPPQCHHHRLDLNGNSVRGILFAKELAKVYQMHIFENLSDAKMKVKPKESHKEPQKEPRKEPDYKSHHKPHHKPPTNQPKENNTHPSGYHSSNDPNAVTSSWHLDVSDMKMNPLKVPPNISVAFLWHVALPTSATFLCVLIAFSTLVSSSAPVFCSGAPLHSFIHSFIHSNTETFRGIAGIVRPFDHRRVRGGHDHVCLHRRTVRCGVVEHGGLRRQNTVAFGHLQCTGGGRALFVVQKRPCVGCRRSLGRHTDGRRPSKQPRRNHCVDDTGVVGDSGTMKTRLAREPPCTPR
jgi:hypothetical protein